MKTDTISKQLLFSTVRIETSNKKEAAVGTGFVVAKKIADKQQYLFLVTNRHVVEGYDKGKIFFHRKKDDNEVDIGNKFDFVIKKMDQLWTFHENKEIDIAILPIAPLINKARNKYKTELFIRAIPLGLIPSEKQTRDLDAIEEVLFIGYPRGIYDEVNFLPIVRKGITATPMETDFNGIKTFLIDASVFRGSSGSPVFIFKEGGYNEKDRFVIGRRKIFLCGVVAETFFDIEEGELRWLKSKQEKIKGKIISETKQMIDLGLVFKSSLIKDMVEKLIKEISAHDH